MGDVVLSIPALHAIRKQFPKAKITVLVGKAASDVLTLCNPVDEILPVDRTELRNSPKLWAIGQLFRLAADVRRRKFDLVIDLHSFYETNILGFLSGAKLRLYANRENRSLDFLANFRPRPPLEDKTKHIIERYLDVLKPLGIINFEGNTALSPHPADIEYIEETWFGKIAESTAPLAGLFPGAGNPSRCWSLANFAELAKRLSDDKFCPVVFLGPEEAGLKDRILKTFPTDTMICDKLTIPQFIAASARLTVFVANDTGPLHLASAAGTPSVVVLDERAPAIYLPLTEKLRAVRSGKIDEIQVEDVYNATRNLLSSLPHFAAKQGS